MIRKKILVVDDSATSIMWQRLILRPEPFDVVIATDGEAGVEAVRVEHPDLVLMDVMMPRLDGFSAVRALRQDPATKHVKIIMVTTRGEDENIQKGYACGCDDYVTKPIEKSVYLAKIRGLLS